MSPLVFLGIAMALSLIGVLVLWARHRPPTSVDAQIKAFSKELEALAPDPPPASEPHDTPPPPASRPPIGARPVLPPTKPPQAPLPKRGRRSG